MALWGGRFEGGPDALFKELNDSLPFDYLLAREDIEGSIGWAKAIARAGVLTDEELTRLTGALNDLLGEVKENPETPLEAGSTQRPHAERGGTQGGTRYEDVHSWVEARLIGMVGDLGKKLHTGRSRNDQVATDLRMWTRGQIRVRVEELKAARGALIEFAEKHADVVLPGYTHLQRAQPVALAHWALAYEEMLTRDAARLGDALQRVNVCPLGSGALAGTAYAIDRDALAKNLGFDAPTANSLDAVSDRDFVVETLAALALLGVHLSRLGEDLVLYGSQEFGFLVYDDAFASGSSLMPQKKNPDAAELLRGKSGRVVGALVSLLVTLKGLPTAYNKDLQEDKEPLFDAMRHASLCLRAAARILTGVEVRREACESAAAGGYSNATDLADYLVSKGVPFREAHEQVGKLVRVAIEAGRPLEKLTVEEMRAVAPAVGPDVFGKITTAAGLANREVLGGTGPKAVAAAIRAARARLER